jgi:outer membrane protein assembly factor BamB
MQSRLATYRSLDRRACCSSTSRHPSAISLALSLILGCWLSGMAAMSLAEDWPQWRGPTADGRWTETGLMDKFPAPSLATTWRVPIGPGYSGPTVARGRIYVMDRQTSPKEVERVLCFDEKTGESLWVHAYECQYNKAAAQSPDPATKSAPRRGYSIGYTAGPRASVVIEEGRAYSIGATGHAFALDAATGQVIWSRDLEQDYQIDMPIWGVAASPVLVGDLVVFHIGGRPGACVVALDARTGKERWKALDDRAQYATPVLVRQGDRTVLVVWTGDSVVGLDPVSGAVHWRDLLKPRNMPIGVASPVVAGDRLFCTSFYDGSLLLKLDAAAPKAERLWHRVGRSERDTDALQSIISTPIVLGDHVYGVDSYGELRCLELRSGDRVWEDLTATPKSRWSTIHFVQNGDRTWMFNERGQLIIARLTPKGYEEISRAQLIEPTLDQLNQRGGVCWSHPAFANKHIVARNDKELVRASLAAP